MNMTIWQLAIEHQGKVLLIGSVALSESQFTIYVNINSIFPAPILCFLARNISLSKNTYIHNILHPYNDRILGYKNILQSKIKLYI